MARRDAIRRYIGRGSATVGAVLGAFPALVWAAERRLRPIVEHHGILAAPRLPPESREAVLALATELKGANKAPWRQTYVRNRQLNWSLVGCRRAPRGCLPRAPVPFRAGISRTRPGAGSPQSRWCRSGRCPVVSCSRWAHPPGGPDATPSLTNPPNAEWRRRSPVGAPVPPSGPAADRAHREPHARGSVL